MSFYKETDLKEFDEGIIPKGWELKIAGQLCQEVTDGTHDSPKPVDKGYFLITSKHIGNGKIGFSDAYRISKADYEKANRHSKADVGDVLFSMIGTIGLTAKVSKEYPPFALKNVGLFKLGGDEYLADWLQYYFQSGYAQRYYNKGLKGSTQKYIPLYTLRKFPIVLPPMPEMIKITEVLDVVDSAIELADRVIAKTELLKRGLMGQLLTRGIGHTEYKQTPAGKIPKEWEEVELRELILDIQNGFASGKRDEKGIAQIRMNNLTTDGRLLLDSYLKVPIPEKINRWLLKPNDFLFNNTNSIELVGKSAVFKGAPFPCTFSNHFTRIRFKEDLVNPDLILYHFITHWEKGYFRSVAIRHVGQAAVHTEYLLRLKIPLPSLIEQHKIVDMLSTTNRKLELERLEKVRTEKIKAGLMDLLLTGKVRIKVD